MVFSEGIEVEDLEINAFKTCKILLLVPIACTGNVFIPEMVCKTDVLQAHFSRIFQNVFAVLKIKRR